MVLLGLCSCVVSSVHLTPAAERVTGARVKEPIEATRADIPALEAAGGERIALVDAEGSAFDEQPELLAKALSDGAQLGGTHVVLLTKSTVFVDVWLNKGPATFHRPVAGFVVYRVPESRWAELPPSLRLGALRSDACTHEDPRWATASALEKREFLRGCRDRQSRSAR